MKRINGLAILLFDRGQNFNGIKSLRVGCIVSPVIVIVIVNNVTDLNVVLVIGRIFFNNEYYFLRPTDLRSLFLVVAELKLIYLIKPNDVFFQSEIDFCFVFFTLSMFNLISKLSVNFVSQFNINREMIVPLTIFERPLRFVIPNHFCL